MVVIALLAAVQWGEPALVGPEVISSDYSEIRATVSPDGKLLLWGSTNRPGGPKGWNIWLARRAGAEWSAPQAVSFNSDANDFDPAFAPDGHWIYFFSNRPGGLGGDDLYRVPVVGAGFGAVEHLGLEVNSAGDEWAPALSPDGKTLLFASNGRGGRGRHDLFIARANNHTWGRATPLPGAINSPIDELDASFLDDGNTVVFARSVNVETETITLHVAQRGAAGYERGTPLPFSAKYQYALGPALDWHNSGQLYFSAAPLTSKNGRADVYSVRYRIKTP